jgi:hypothetical protein
MLRSLGCISFDVLKMQKLLLSVFDHLMGGIAKESNVLGSIKVHNELFLKMCNGYLTFVFRDRQGKFLIRGNKGGTYFNKTNKIIRSNCVILSLIFKYNSN